MKKRIIGRKKTVALWFSREELFAHPHYQLIEKFHTPQVAKDAVQDLVELGWFDTRINDQGIQQYRLNLTNLIRVLGPDWQKIARDRFEEIQG